MPVNPTDSLIHVLVYAEHYVPMEHYLSSYLDFDAKIEDTCDHNHIRNILIPFSILSVLGNYKTRLSESEEGLKGALQAWDDFDALFDTLNKWLKENEAKVKDHELKNSLDDKKQQLEKFKVRFEITS